MNTNGALRVLFFGTPDLAATSLKYLIEHGVNVVGIVTQPDRPKGRSGKATPPPVKAAAQLIAPELPIHQPEKASSPESATLIETFQADLFVIVAYGEILRDNLLNMPKLGCINLHLSLLPKYRGAAPIHYALLNGDAESGVTVIHLAKKMDAGDIIRQERLKIGDETTLPELYEGLANLGNAPLNQAIRDLEAGTAARTPQDHSQATYCSKITPDMGEIDWTRTAQELHNQVRALTPKPGAWCILDIGGAHKKMKILRSKPSRRSGAAGTTLAFGGDDWVIACGTGSLEILEVQLEGRRAMPAAEQMRGLTNPTVALCPHSND